jgi:hypothetical protein
MSTSTRTNCRPLLAFRGGASYVDEEVLIRLVRPDLDAGTAMSPTVLSRLLVSRRRAASMAVVLSLLASGCTSRHVEPAVVFEPKEVAGAAFNDYDTNKDGYLDVRELDRAPGLKSCLKELDKDKDGRLSRAELEECLTAIQEVHLGTFPVTCKVTLNGTPLAGAEVVVEPEPFMASHIKRAKGTTDEQGKTVLRLEDAVEAGCQPGFYRVQISMPEGGAALPARYNSQTQLGLGVGPGLGGRGSGIYLFALTTP